MECNKYQDGLIYTIKTDNGLYVGSTCDFVARKRSHKSVCFNENNKEYQKKIYQNIRENGGEYSIEIYKMFPCNNEKELLIEENIIIQTLNCNLNSKASFQSIEERKEYEKLKDSKRDRRQDNKKYYEQNREKELQRCKKYSMTKITCECGCETTRGHISRHRKSKKHLNLMNLPESV